MVGTWIRGDNSEFRKWYRNTNRESPKRTVKRKMGKTEPMQLANSPTASLPKHPKKRINDSTWTKVDKKGGP